MQSSAFSVRTSVWNLTDYLQLKFIPFLVLIRLQKKIFLQIMVNTKFYIVDTSFFSHDPNSL